MIFAHNRRRIGWKMDGKAGEKPNCSDGFPGAFTGVSQSPADCDVKETNTDHGLWIKFVHERRKKWINGEKAVDKGFLTPNPVDNYVESVE